MGNSLKKALLFLKSNASTFSSRLQVVFKRFSERTVSYLSCLLPNKLNRKIHSPAFLSLLNHLALNLGISSFRRYF